MKRRMAVLVLIVGLLSVPAAWAASDEEQIDEVISQFWQSYQMGDYETMAKYVADDVVVVSGTFGPPVQGWTAVRQAYESQRGTWQNISINRQNTRITVRGKCAWATQEWVFNAVANRQPISTAGHTTLIFEKRSGRWLIVLNHTSVSAVQQPAPAQPPAANPPKQ